MSTHRWKRIAGRVGAGLLVLAALVVASMFLWLPAKVARDKNPVALSAPYSVSDEAQELHQKLFVADMQSGALMWGRDPVAGAANGHVDLPRLQQGGVALQFFAAATRVPPAPKAEGNTPGFDILGVMNFFQGWPMATWHSPRERALYMAGRMEKATRQTKFLQLIRTREDLERFAAQREETPNHVAGVLALEGLHALEGDRENVRVFLNAGYRVMSFSHLHDNALCGSARGVDKGGLTDFGRDVLAFMEILKVIPDLAHASNAAIDDILAAATRPVMVSHTGLKALHEAPGNLSDEQLQRIAAQKGVIGIGFWHEATGAMGTNALVRALRHAVSVAGVDHVALGSGFDGGLEMPFDVSGMPLVTKALLEAQFTPEEIAKIMGGNVQRFLIENLPTESDTAYPDQKAPWK
jgi:membrane dipeptidase